MHRQSLPRADPPLGYFFGVSLRRRIAVAKSASDLIRFLPFSDEIHASPVLEGGDARCSGARSETLRQAQVERG
jgi:hypothetical protein